MGKDPDQTFLFRETVLDHVIADEKCLNGRFWDLSHGRYSRERMHRDKAVPVYLPYLRRGGECALSSKRTALTKKLRSRRACERRTESTENSRAASGFHDISEQRRA